MKNVLKQNNNIKNEVLAGCTTFVASVYIILTNALILSDAGISSDAAMMATIFTCVLSTILMGVLSDTPFVVVPGMGINSLFTYTIVHSMGLSWQESLGAVLQSLFQLIFTSNTKPLHTRSKVMFNSSFIKANAAWNAGVYCPIAGSSAITFEFIKHGSSLHVYLES